MAQRTVRVLRAFNGINRDQDAEEKQRYFTADNERSAEEFLSDEELQYRVEQGFLSVEETREPQPLVFAPPTNEAAAEEPAPVRRRRPAAGSEE